MKKVSVVPSIMAMRPCVEMGLFMESRAIWFESKGVVFIRVEVYSNGNSGISGGWV